VTLVVDASIAVAALTDSGPIGAWARALLQSKSLAAPHLMPAEAGNILRRLSLTRDITADGASMAYAELMTLRVELFSYGPLASRVWELRGNATAYDAWYVALAEALGARLATLDLRLSRASGPRCDFAVPPS